MPWAIVFTDFYYGVIFIFFNLLTCSNKGKNLHKITFNYKIHDIVFRKQIRRFYTWIHYLFFVKLLIFFVSVVVPDGMGAVKCSENGQRVIYVDVDGHVFVATYMSGSILFVLIAIKQIFWDAVHKRPESKCGCCLRVCWLGNK